MTVDHYDHLIKCLSLRYNNNPNINRCLNDVSSSKGLSKYDVASQVVDAFSNIAFEKVVEKLSDNSIILQPHQKTMIEYMLSHRGAVADFGTGSGKTLTSIVTAECLRRIYSNLEIIVITPASLQDNFKKEIIQAGFSLDPYNFYTYESFVNSNYQSNKNTFMIIDEAHNLRTEYRKVRGELETRSKFIVEQAMKVFKILLLTATPRYNDNYDLANLIAMVKGTLPLTKKEFNALIQYRDYVVKGAKGDPKGDFRSDPKDDPGDVHDINRRKFDEYFGCVFMFYNVEYDSKDFPTRVDEIVEFVMDEDYYDAYYDIQRGNAKILNISDPMAFYTGMRIATSHIEPNYKYDWAIEKIKSKFKEGKKVLVYSSFLDIGIYKMQERLNAARIPYLSITGQTKKSERQEIVDRYNNNEVLVLLISKAGSEGLDLKETDSVILLESLWNDESEKQIVGRAIRYQSHKPNSKVYVYRLILKKPNFNQMGSQGIIRRNDDKIGSGDEILKGIAEQKAKELDNILDMIIPLSIDQGEC